MDVAIETRIHIDALVTEFAYRIDQSDGFGVADLFVPDGVYGFAGAGQMCGRAAIEEFYENRRAAGQRISRHLFSNLHLSAIDDSRVRGTCVLQLYAASGPGPHPIPPVMIADYIDEYVRDENDHWRFASRHAALIFGERPHIGHKGN